MLKAYLAHPYETYRTPEENRILEESLYNILKVSNPNVEFVRPLKRVPDDISRVEAMKRCFDLIDTCDILFAAPDWIRSAGCRAEVDYALSHGLPVKTLDVRRIEILDLF